MKKRKLTPKMLISIIIPVFNSRLWLEKCLNSLLDQSFKDFEIIAVNDGSTDDSESILKRIATKDKRLSFYTINNSGVSYARNFGIGKAKGKYLMFVDSDDYVDGLFLEGYTESLTDFDLVIGGYCYFFEANGKIIQFPCKNQIYQKGDFFKDIEFFLRPPYLLGPCFKLFKRSIVVNNAITFPLDLSYGEDAEFVYSYLEHCSTIKSIQNTSYYYRRSSNNTLSTVSLDNRMAIYYRLSTHLERLLIENNVQNTDEIVSTILSYNFIGFCHEIVSASKPFFLMRKTFFDNAKTFKMKAVFSKNKNKTKAMHLVRLSILMHIFFPLFVLFKLHDRKHGF